MTVKRENDAEKPNFVENYNHYIRFQPDFTMKILRFATLLITCALAGLSMRAENYPSRSDCLRVTNPDHSDWLYETGDSAVISVELYRYGVPADGVTVSYEIGPDMLPADKSGSLTLKNGRADINIGTMTKPGFRDLRLVAEFDGHKFPHHVKVGFSPEKLKPYVKEPKDFMKFSGEGCGRG